MSKALRTFDRLTLAILLISWTTTLVVMGLALYTSKQAAAAHTASETALVAEPVLPQVVPSGVGGKELQTMLDRMQRHFPDLGIVWQNNVLQVNGKDASRFHLWMIAIGQIDTLYPQFHWSVQGMCVGKLCPGDNLMSIGLVGQKFAFEMPQPDSK
jgi:hypothetical protein